MLLNNDYLVNMYNLDLSLYQINYYLHKLDYIGLIHLILNLYILNHFLNSHVNQSRFLNKHNYLLKKNNHLKNIVNLMNKMDIYYYNIFDMNLMNFL